MLIGFHITQDHASERGDARNSLRSKRPQAGSRRVGESEDPSGAYPTKAEAKQFAVEAEVSSGDEEGHERRGRSKIQRWNSRNEREIVVPTSAVEEKRHRRPHAREGDVPSDAPNDQNASEKRQVCFIPFLVEHNATRSLIATLQCIQPTR